MEKAIERVLFASRWLMAPMYLGLVGALAILLWAFLVELWHFALALPGIGVDEAVMGALALIDLSLAANLLVIVIFSGYENFVSKMNTEGHEDRPDWQDEVDFSALKLKLVASIVAISGIHLLKKFMEIRDIDTAVNFGESEMLWLVVIHLTFVVSGVLMALMDYLQARSYK